MEFVEKYVKEKKYKLVPLILPENKQPDFKEMEQTAALNPDSVFFLRNTADTSYFFCRLGMDAIDTFLCHKTSTYFFNLQTSSVTEIVRKLDRFLSAPKKRTCYICYEKFDDSIQCARCLFSMCQNCYAKLSRDGEFPCPQCLRVVR